MSIRWFAKTALYLGRRISRGNFIARNLRLCMGILSEMSGHSHKICFNRKQYMNTSVNLAGIKMKNPVTTAAGTFGYGEPFKEFFDLKKLGAILVKGTSLDPWKGNAPHRVVETPSGMLNTIGFQNYGVEGFIKKKLPALKEIGIPVIVGVFDKTADNYAKVAERLSKEKGIDGFEVNLSCPNLEAGGKTFCDDASMAFEVVKRIRQITGLPLIAKLSPNVTDIVALAQAVKDAGAEAVSMINTVVGMRIDIKTRKPYVSRNVGGLSGPAIRPIAVAKVFLVSRAKLGIPILGMGGIATAEDAIEFLMAGASAVAVGTANFVNPYAVAEIIDGIEKYMKKNNIDDVKDLIGSVVPHEV